MVRKTLIASAFVVMAVSGTAAFITQNGSFQRSSVNSSNFGVRTTTKDKSCWNSNLYQVVNNANLDVSLSMTLSTRRAQIDESTIESSTKRLSVPLSFNEMCKEVASAMSDSYNEYGMTRQIVRVLLPRDPSNAQLGMLYENDAILSSNSRFGNVSLVPPDETWQGGIMQLYRAATPTCCEILREFSPTPSGLPPKLLEDRSVDESGVDGIGLWMTENVDPKEDVSCFVQPSQESIDYIERVSNQAKGRLVMLMNPQWRSVDDALDATSKTEGFFGMLASSLGGKGNSLRRLDALDYNSVYAIEGYICKGRDIRLIKRFDSNWRVFVADSDGDNYKPVGTSVERPTYQECDKMLDEAGIVLSYI